MHRAALTFVVFAAPAFIGCGSSAYTPRPSPRLQVVADGGGIALAKNGRSYPVGMFGSGLEDAVQGNRRAEEEVRSYQGKSIGGFITGILGSVGSAAGAGLLVANEVKSNPSSEARIAGISLAIGGVVLSLVGTLVASSAQPHMWNAINIYNDDLPPPWGFGQQQPQGGAQPYPGKPYNPYNVPPPYIVPSAPAPMPSAPLPMQAPPPGAPMQAPPPSAPR